MTNMKSLLQVVKLACNLFRHFQDPKSYIWQSRLEDIISIGISVCLRWFSFIKILSFTGFPCLIIKNKWLMFLTFPIKNGWFSSCPSLILRSLCNWIIWRPDTTAATSNCRPGRCARAQRCQGAARHGQRCAYRHLNMKRWWNEHDNFIQFPQNNTSFQTVLSTWKSTVKTTCLSWTKKVLRKISKLVPGCGESQPGLASDRCEKPVTGATSWYFFWKFIIYKWLGKWLDKCDFLVLFVAASIIAIGTSVHGLTSHPLFWGIKKHEERPPWPQMPCRLPGTWVSSTSHAMRSSITKTGQNLGLALGIVTIVASDTATCYLWNFFIFI